MESERKGVATLLVVALLAGSMGGLTVWIFQGHSLEIVPDEVSYTELAAVLLTAVSVLVAVFGVVVALLAVWGYRNFRRVAKSAAEIIAREVASAEVVKEMREGAAGSVIDEKIFGALDAMKNGKYEVWREERDAQTARMNALDQEYIEDE